VRKVILLGTSHTIQRGENSPEQFKQLIANEFLKHRFAGIAEEIDDRSVYLAEEFCKQNGLKYRCIEPNAQERRDLSIPSANDIVLEIQEDFGEQYPGISYWPADPSAENIPSEVWKAYSERTEASYRAREAEWLDRIVKFDVWPVLCLCGAHHFLPFSELLRSKGIQVTESHQDWMPA
jgi:hypothetical protein